jgi:glycosyltransferase involved in cell wall biosynthesis
VDSVLNQTFKDFELILVDDGSPDNCPAICDEYTQNDNRVVVIHQKNGGLSAARNAGIDWAFANSDSQWLTFLDSDDFWYERYLEVMLLAVTECQTYISTCNATQCDFSGDPEYYIPKKYPTEQAFCDKTILRHRIPAWGKLYHKSLWADIRYPVGKIHEDRFTTHKVLFQVPEIATIKARMYYVTPNPNSITRVKWSPKRLDHIEAIEAELSFFKNSPYRKAELRTAISGLYEFAQTIHDIQHCDESDQFKEKNIAILQNKLRYYIKQYKNELHLSCEVHPQIFEAAYPTEMKLYWLSHAILRKIRK